MSTSLKILLMAMIWLFISLLIDHFSNGLVKRLSFLEAIIISLFAEFCIVADEQKKERGGK